MAWEVGSSPLRRARGGSLVPWLASLALAVLGARVPAASPQGDVPQAAPPDAESFAREYEAAAELTKDRRWKPAREAWLALLRRHAGMDYVRPRTEEVRAALRKGAFWLVTKEPPPREVVTGDLRHYSTASGRIQIRYGLYTLGDFERVAGSEEDTAAELGLRPRRSLYLHPLTFRGPYRLTLEGTPQELGNVSLFVALDEQGGGYAVQIGAPSGELYSEHRLLSVTGHRSTELARSEPARPAKAIVRAEVKVESHSLAFTYDGKQVFRAENERGWGGFGLATTGPFGELELDGVVEPSWIDGRQDAFVQSAREAFEKTYADPPELEAWKDVRPAIGAGERMARMFGNIPMPGNYMPDQVALLERASALRTEGRPLEAAAFLRELAPEALPPGARDLSLLLCECEAGRPTQALRHLREYELVTELTPALRFLKAHLLGRVEGEEEAIGILRELAAADPGEPLFHHELTRSLLGAGRPDEARAALERGLQAASPMPELSELRVQLVKATLGPEWRQTFRHASQRFAVASDLEAEICRLAARELDEAWEKCCEWFGPLAPSARPPTRAYLFSGEESYRAYIRGIADATPEDTRGVYSTWLDQIVSWNAANRESLLATLRHECVHHYLDLALGQIPTWLDEGLADYVAASKTSPRRWQEGAPHPERVATLREHAGELSPLAVFLRLEPPEFLAQAELHYAEAWALVHFLRRSGDPAAAALRTRLWQALAGPTDVAAALELALEGVDVALLEQRFRAWLPELVDGADARREAR